MQGWKEAGPQIQGKVEHKKPTTTMNPRCKITGCMGHGRRGLGNSRDTKLDYAGLWCGAEVLRGRFHTLQGKVGHSRDPAARQHEHANATPWCLILPALSPIHQQALTVPCTPLQPTPHPHVLLTPAARPASHLWKGNSHSDSESKRVQAKSPTPLLAPPSLRPSLTKPAPHQTALHLASRLCGAHPHCAGRPGSCRHTVWCRYVPPWAGRPCPQSQRTCKASTQAQVQQQICCQDNRYNKLRAVKASMGATTLACY